jgi:hypothetical protein
MLQAIVKNLSRVIVSDTVPLLGNANSSRIVPSYRELIYLNMHCNITATASTPLSSVLFSRTEAKCQEAKQ